MPRLSNLVLIHLLLLLPVPAQTVEPPREPMLRIETGMHTASIRRIGTDAGNRFLVTASDDKTLRVWELPTGRLLRIIRVPIGTGDEGKLFAVALSPDGTTIAASGWTSPDGVNTNIYIFERESGRLLRRLSKQPNVINHLVYSPDGRYLAVALGNDNGVRVYQTQDYSLAGEDTDYKEETYCADFNRANQLVTISYDGFARLYSPAGDGVLRLVAKQKVAGGARPFSISFSPDGSRVAVAFVDSTRVAVLSGRDLSPLYVPDTSDVKNGHLGRVAWSADGKTLYAGGTAGSGANNDSFIRVWTDGGRGAHRDISGVTPSTIFHILPLREGGVVYGTGDPAFGALDASGRRVLYISPAIADLRNNQKGFLVSPDGTNLGFAYELFGRSPALFSLAERRLEAAPANESARWQPPATEANGLRVTDWRDAYEPKLNGTRLKLEQYERSRSLAVAPDAGSFLLGTSFWLRLFGRNGVERWKVTIPDETWAVNISGDGRLAVAAYGDGTIRWHDMKDGRELLAFFPHADRKRWVVWTPSGYYDASPGAEELIGWHVNNGRDRAADFFPVGQFRDVFYRPDVVSKVLATRDEQLALRAANEEAGRKQEAADVSKLLPPVVEIVSPSEGAELGANEIVVRFNVRTPSGEPVTDVKALVDGRPVATGRGLGLQTTGQGARELRLTVPAGESLVSIIAANRFTSSVPATVRVRARRQPVPVNAATPNRAVNGANAAPASEGFEIRPKLYVLAVGVSNYADPKLKLGFAAKDAQDFAASWERQRGDLYRDVVIKVLTDDRATKDEVLDGLDWIRKETTSKDVAVVLFAGHGVNDPNGIYYFLPFNANTDKLLRTGVSFSDIKNTVAALAGKTLFFIDTCHSGNVLGSTRRGLLGALGDINGIVNELASAENGAVVFAASTGNQFSLEHEAWNNGAFTKAIVEGLGGGADYDKSGKGRITLNMLDLYISERVKELTKGQQTPTTAKPQTVPDFPIALKK